MLKDKVNELLKDAYDNSRMRGDYRFKGFPRGTGDNTAVGDRLGIVAKEPTRKDQRTPAIGYIIPKGPKAIDFYVVDRGFMGTNITNARVFAKFCKWEGIEVALIDRSGPAEVDVLIGQDGYPLADNERYSTVVGVSEQAQESEKQVRLLTNEVSRLKSQRNFLGEVVQSYQRAKN